MHVPAWQVPTLQLSPSAQKVPSSRPAHDEGQLPSSTWMHPKSSGLLQTSTVHGSPSAHPGPGTHRPAPSQRSTSAQLSPSTHGGFCGRGPPPTVHGQAPGISTFTHPPSPVAQRSLVHELPSSQSSGPTARHSPAWQTLTEHAAPEQLVPSGRSWKTQPTPAWHMPVLHGGTCSGSQGESWVHRPSRQRSSVHGSPSLAHAGPVAGRHPLFGSQPGPVQGSPSLAQTSNGTIVHVGEHASQKSPLPSSHCSIGSSSTPFRQQALRSGSSTIWGAGETTAPAVAGSVGVRVRTVSTLQDSGPWRPQGRVSTCPEMVIVRPTRRFRGDVWSTGPDESSVPWMSIVQCGPRAISPPAFSDPPVASIVPPTRSIPGDSV